MNCFSFGLKNEFETAVVNEPSVFEPLKFYCTCHFFHLRRGINRIYDAVDPVERDILVQWVRNAYVLNLIKREGVGTNK